MNKLCTNCKEYPIDDSTKLPLCTNCIVLLQQKANNNVNYGKR